MVSIVTGGHVTTNDGEPTSNLVGKSVASFTLSGLKSGTVVAPWKTDHSAVLIFFASWCGPCQSEMPKVAAYLRHHNEGSIHVVGIDANDERGAAKTFVKKSGVTFPVAFDANGVVTNGLFKFATLPETVFLTSKGIVKQVYFGAIPKDVLVQGHRVVASRELVEAEGACRDERRDERPGAQHDPVGSGRYETLTQHAVQSFGHGPRGQCDGDSTDEDRQRRQRYDDAREQQEHQIQTVARGEIDLRAESPGERQSDAGAPGRTEHQERRDLESTARTAVRAPRQGERDERQDDDLQCFGYQHAGDLRSHETTGAERRHVKTPQDPVTAFEGRGDRERDERRREDTEGQHARRDEIDSALGRRRDHFGQGEEQEQQYRYSDGEQQRLAAAQRHPDFGATLCPPGVHGRTS